MTTDPNTEWNYAKLKGCVLVLQEERKSVLQRLKSISKSPFLVKALAGEAAMLGHAIDFIEFNMKEMNIVPDSEHYLQMK